MRRVRAMIIGGIAAAALAACSSGAVTPSSSTPQSPATGTPATDSTHTGSTATGTQTGSTTSGTTGGAGPTNPAEATVAGMLAMVPDTAATRTYTVVNLYWKAAQAGGVTVPAADAASGTLGHYAMDLTANLDTGIGMAGSDLLTELTRGPDASNDLFTIPDIAADVEAGQPPSIAIAARGRFDTGAIDTALRGNADWKGDLTTPSYHGHTIYRWLDDLKMDMSRLNTGLFTMLGQSRRMAFPDSSTFLFGRDDATIHALLDAGDDRSGSLGSDADHHDVAAALDDLGVYSALLVGPQTLGPTVGSAQVSPEEAKQLTATLTKQALRPYALAGIGETIIGGEPRTVIVLANADAAGAKANADALRGLITSGQSLRAHRPWSDFFGVGSVTADGRLTIGVLTLTDPGSVTAWHQSVLSRDTLLAAG